MPMVDRHGAGWPSWQTAAVWVADREVWFVLLAVPPFLLPEFLAFFLPLATALLLLLVLCRLLTRHTLRFGGLLDVAVLLLVVMLPVSLLVSSDPARSFPKFCATIIGLALFWSLATGLQRQGLRKASLLLAGSGLGLALLGLVGTDWPRSKLLYISGLYDRLPRLMMSLPRATRGRFDPNEVAGALVLLVPVVLAVLVGVWVQRREDCALSLADLLPARWRRVFVQPALLVVLLALTLAAMLAVFVLTQSRGAMVALAAGVAVMVILAERRLALLTVVLAVGALVWDATLGGGRVAGLLGAVASGAQTGQGPLAALLGAAHTLASAGSGDSASASGRIEMWQNAWRAIVDYPLTGIGLHTFPAVSWANYSYTVVSPTWNMTHAHNAYLQAGVDFGLAGLAGFLLLAAVILRRGWRFLRSRPAPFERWLACGILGGVVGHLAHSVVDVAGRPLGDKPGIIFWAMAGLLLAADRLALPQVQAGRKRSIGAAGRFVAVAAAVLALCAAWALTMGPLLPVTRLNLGALALDQARLKPGISAEKRTQLVQSARQYLQATLPWRADSVYLRLGIAEDELGRIEQARSYWMQTAQALPYLIAQGDAHLLTGQTAQAKAYFEHALALSPSSSSLLYRLGVMSSAEGRAAEALDVLNKALIEDSYANRPLERARTYAAIAGIMAGQGRWVQAVAAYEQAQAVAPRFTWQRELALALYRRDGNGSAAEAYLRQSIQQMPGQVEPYVGLMNVLYDEGRYEEAVDLGKKTIKRFAEAIEPLLYLGRIYLEGGFFDQAEDMFRRVVTLRPRLTDARLWLVRVAMEKQDSAAALAVLDEAIALSPQDAALHVGLGDVKRTIGDLAGAEQAYRRALVLQPNNPAAKQGLESVAGR